MSVTVAQRFDPAALAALPAEYGTSFTVGWKPKIQRPSLLIGAAWADHDPLPVPQDRQRHPGCRGSTGSIRDTESNVGVRRPSTATIVVADLQAGGGRRSAAFDSCHFAAGRCEGPPLIAKTRKRIANATATFANGPARDDGDPLPRRAAPVGVGRGSLLDFTHAALGRAPRAGRQVSSRQLALELRVRAAGLRRNPRRPARAWTAPTAETRLGCSRRAGSRNTRRSRAAGRFMPGKPHHRRRAGSSRSRTRCRCAGS